MISWLHCFGEFSRIAGASSIYFRSLCLKGSDLGRRLPFMSLPFFHFEMYLCWDLFGSWLHLYGWWHGYCWDVFWFSAVTLYVEIFLCMITWWFIRRRDDYFLYNYCNCMIYCLNRNRVLHGRFARIYVEIDFNLLIFGQLWIQDR